MTAPRCPRCGGRLLYEPLPAMVGGPLEMLSCLNCGEQLYGPAAIDALHKLGIKVPRQRRGRPPKAGSLADQIRERWPNLIGDAKDAIAAKRSERTRRGNETRRKQRTEDTL